MNSGCEKLGNTKNRSEFSQSLFMHFPSLISYGKLTMGSIKFASLVIQNLHRSGQSTGCHGLGQTLLVPRILDALCPDESKRMFRIILAPFLWLGSNATKKSNLRTKDFILAYSSRERELVGERKRAGHINWLIMFLKQEARKGFKSSQSITKTTLPPAHLST